ncbi:MAG: DUF4168 domain-containing protein, partial [Brevundimonas sp.]|nr:DUF4168 domain-containing protein [Brevundimonas sp.]
MRTSLFAAVSCAALLAVAAAPAAALPALTSAPAGVSAVSDTISDDELRSFATAMEAVQPIAAAVTGGAPTAEQQAQMATAIEASGLA